MASTSIDSSSLGFFRFLYTPYTKSLLATLDAERGALGVSNVRIGSAYAVSDGESENPDVPVMPTIEKSVQPTSAATTIFLLATILAETAFAGACAITHVLHHRASSVELNAEVRCSG